jgi:hypothetical protein
MPDGLVFERTVLVSWNGASDGATSMTLPMDSGIRRSVSMLQSWSPNGRKRT